MPYPTVSVALETFVTFGDLLRYLRRRAGLTQRELAIGVGYSDGQISRLEQNLRLPDLATITARFAPTLGLEHEPDVLKRLMELAAATDRHDAPAPGSSPFMGLHHFDEADADLFYGREALVARLTARLTATPDQASPCRFLALVGASGSGKSSIVRAGLIPALRWNPASAHWSIFLLTPTSRPLKALAFGITPEGGSVSTTATLIDDLSRDPRTLSLYLRRFASDNVAGPRSVPGIAPGIPGPQPASHIVLVVDQFEELFTQCRDETERRAFIDNLMTAAADRDGDILVVIALRADFYSSCAPYGALREALAGDQEYIGPMTPAELRRAIEEPARHAGWELEPGLADVLLKEVEGEPGGLPLLSHALFETWERRRGRLLTLSGYLAAGGVRGAIAETAESVFSDHLSLEQQVIARNVFLRLTGVGKVDEVSDTRRRVSFDELIPTPEDGPAVRAVLTILADARLITTDEDSVEVAHEALIREWPTLRSWLDENREGLRLHRHLTLAAQEWERRRRDRAELYRGVRLAQALAWAEQPGNTKALNQLEREFLQASADSADLERAEAESRRQRELEAARKLAEAEKKRADEQAMSANRLRLRNRIITAVGAVALVLAALAARSLWASQADLARAESLRLAAEANVLTAENGDPETATLLSLRALNVAYTKEAGEALARALTRIYSRQELKGHTDWVYAAEFSSDGKRAVTASLDGTARLWDLASGQVVQTFVGHIGGVVAAALSPDGQYVLTGGNDTTARLWDAATGRQIRVFVGHTAGLTAVAFSPDGKTILTASGDGTARLWDAATGRELHTFAGHTGLVSAASFSPDGRLVLTASFDHTARVWDVETGQLLQTFYGHTDAVNDAVFSADGKFVLTGSDDQTARVWEVDTGKDIRTLATPTDRVFAVAFSPDGKFALTGGSGRVARLWDTASGEVARTFVGHTGSIRGVAFSTNGYQVLTAGEDKTARVWDSGIGPDLRIFDAHAGGVVSAAFSPDGRYVLTAQGITATLWDVNKSEELRVFSGHVKDLTSAAYSPDGKTVLTGSEDGTARLWHVETGRVVLTLPGHTAGVAGVGFSPDGKDILTTAFGGSTMGFEGLTRVWDSQTGAVRRTFDVGRNLSSGPVAAISPDGKSLLGIGLHSELVLSDLETGAELRTFVGHERFVRSVAFSPDGKYALSGSEDTTARLWEVATGKQIRIFSDQSSMVLSVAFSPDGKYVLTGHSDNTARLWDAATGEELRTLVGHTGPVNSVAFSPDGKTMLTGSDDGTARLWDVDYHDTVRFACSRIWRDLTDDERAEYGITDKAPTCAGAG
jgi:WD40 repeat protein